MCKKSLLMMLLLALFAPWAANAQETLTVHDGTATNGNVPIYGYYADAYLKCEMVYPATELSTMADGTITSLTFYATTPATEAWTGTWQVSVTEIDTTAISAFAGPGTVVYEGALDGTQSTMVIPFSTPYTYNGGNLLVCVYETATGNYKSVTWAGETVNGASVQGYSYTSLDAVSPAQRNFLPKTTFGYLPEGSVFVPAPSNLSVTLTQGNGTVATLAWTENGTATQWQICLNGDETNLIAATTNPWPLTGLTPETAYTAKVRATTADGQSDWSNEVTFTPTDAYQITVNDGTNTHNYVPFYGYYADSDANSQFIIPADGLSAMTWGTIEKLTFYTSTGTAAWNGAVFDIYFSEVDYSAFETAALIDWSELSVKVYTGTVSVANNKMELTLTTPYTYMGGNLLIGFDETTNSSDYPSAPWYGVTQTNNTAVYKYSSNSAVLAKFLPKVTFGYTPGEEPACMWPTNLAAGTPGPRSVELSWTENGTATNWQICVNGDEANPIAANTNPYTLTGLTPETDYTVKVRSNCGTDGYSDWSNEVSFTTDVLCPAPTNFVVSDITAFSANVSWNALSNVTLRYVANPNFFFQGFVTDAGAMADGADASWIKGASTTWGPSGNYAGGYYLADDFTVNTATSLTEIEVYGYQTGSTTESTFTGLYAMILSGNPMEGTVDTIWGDMTTNLMTSTSFTNCYRGSDGQTTATTRPIMAVTASGLNINLAAGTYWLVYGMTGTLSSGPWAVPYSDPVVGNIGDGLQYSSSGWAALTDSGSGAYGPAMKLSFGDIESFDWTTVNNISTGEYAMTNLDPETLYLVQVRANCGSEGNSNWVSKTFTTLSSCLFPTDLAVSNIEARQAVLSWTENGEATEWEVEVVAGDQTTTVSATQNPFTLVGLSPETKYTVRVRSLCSDTDFSEWSLHATFTTDVACHAPGAPTVTGITRDSSIVNWTYEGDVELEYAEDVWRHYDNGVSSSILGYDGTLSWAIMLTPDMLPASQPLTHVAVYEDQQSNTLPITVSIYSGGNDAPGTLLYTEDVTPVGNGFHEFALNEAVTFDATQNLWIVCFSEDQYPAIASSNTGTTNGGWVSLDSGTTWNNYSYSHTWMIRAAFGNNTQTEWVAVNNPASPQTIAGLTPETPYFVRLRAVCGGEDGESVWVNTSFTTDIACPAPTALAATPYALSAELSWEGTSESYTVSYRRPEYEDGGLSETFGTTIPTGWTMYTGLLSNVMGGTALTPATYGWSFGTGNNVFDNHARYNIYGNYQRWLVTPAFTLSSSTFTFDMALTVYTSSSSASPTPGNQPDDKFVVLVSTDNMATWTILRQWDNAGSEYVYDSITNDANGEAVSIDLSAYVGQTVRIAFYGESTVSNGDNNLHIDNVLIGNPQTIVDEWQTVTVDEAAATLTGLMPATIYEWKVQGNCGDFGMSEESAIVTFTTTNDACPVPTNLTVNNETLTATTADLSWNGSPDVESFTVRYRAPEYVVGGLSETFGTSVPTGWTMYTGLLSTVMENPTALTSGSSWAFGTNNGVFDNHARCNIYGNYQRWLVTPAFTLSSSTFTFDMALTVWSSSSSASPTPGNQPDDKFVVLVSTDNMATWTILRQWDNAGSEYVYDSITNDANGEAVSIDLSAYVGQTVNIAFYGESTVSNGDNNLHIDNVVIGNPQVIPATDWQTVTTSDMNVTLTGLTPETPYEAQVKSACSEAEEPWSNTVSFTTLEQTTVTQEIALSEGWNWVSFYVEADNLLEQLEESLGENGLYIWSNNGSIEYDADWGWDGDELEITNEETYLIQTSADCTIQLQGLPANPTEHEIYINPGWNWIGYPNTEVTSIEDALVNFDAEEGDQLWNSEGSSEYDVWGWDGDVMEFVPNQGYMYYSTSSDVKTLVFATGTAKARKVAPSTKAIQLREQNATKE